MSYRSFLTFLQGALGQLHRSGARFLTGKSCSLHLRPVSAAVKGYALQVGSHIVVHLCGVMMFCVQSRPLADICLWPSIWIGSRTGRSCHRAGPVSCRRWRV